MELPSDQPSRDGGPASLFDHLQSREDAATRTQARFTGRLRLQKMNAHHFPLMLTLFKEKKGKEIL